MIEEEYECEFCGSENRNFHYCADCGDDMRAGECFYFEGICKSCYDTEEDLLDN